jgi:predicted dehydrogenase
MMDRRTFVQRLSVAALAVQSVESMAKMLPSWNSCSCTPLLQEKIDRVRKCEIGEITHVFGYTYHDRNLREPLDGAQHHVDIANQIFGAAPISVFATHGREEGESIQAMFIYPGERRMIFRSMPGSAQRNDDQLWVYGSEGSLNLALQGRPTRTAAAFNLTATMLVANQSLREGRELDIPSIG